MVRTRGGLDTSPSQPQATRCCPPAAQQHGLLAAVTHTGGHTPTGSLPACPDRPSFADAPAKPDRRGVEVQNTEHTWWWQGANPQQHNHVPCRAASPIHGPRRLPPLALPCSALAPNQPRALRNRRLHTSAERVSATRRRGCVKTGISHTTSHALRRPLAHTYAVARQGQSETLTMKTGWDSRPPPPLRLTRSHFQLAHFTTSQPSPTPPAAGVFLFACLLGAVGGLGITTAGMVAAVHHDTCMHASRLVRGR
ncbi:hypothetical protein BT67DRAFT_149352 [Trichocladium antarcticum]|uniref:Uncharacterized protein n=1 Tax=Trichocladium antarcticum TaxID=1450529 RepID=A0AAN6UFG1_9PEZI|nr:hypothetical protein BT67DRAFT_149352 [Trichocladium antarcticum]